MLVIEEQGKIAEGVLGRKQREVVPDILEPEPIPDSVSLHRDTR